MTAPTRDRPRVRVPIDPRIRERRLGVQRDAARRRLRVTLIVASTIVVIGLAYLVVRSPLLDIDRVRISGARRESAAEIQHAARTQTGDPLLLVDTGAITRRIERLRWVERANVRRDLPGTLDIRVVEYVPTAYVRASKGRVVLIASNGEVIAIARTPPLRAVEVRGLRVVPAVGSLLSPPEAADAVRKLPARLAARVDAVDVGKAVVALDLRGGGQVRLGSLDGLAAKGASALAVLDNLHGQPFDYIDVSAPRAPVSG